MGNGHEQKVVSLSVSPVDDTILSGSLDRTARLWDLRAPDCLGLMQCQGRPVASFDPEGLIFAVGVQSEQIKLYDVRSFDKGPFSTFKYPIETGCDWTGIKFSLDGKMMMLTTNGAVIRVIDAYEGKPMFTLAGYQNNKGLPIEASFTPDSQFVVSGSIDGLLHLWRTEDGRSAGVLSICGCQGSLMPQPQTSTLYRVGCNAMLLPIGDNKDIREEEEEDTLLGGSTEMINGYRIHCSFFF